MRISKSALLRTGLAAGAALILSSCASSGGDTPSTGNRAVDLLVQTEDLQAELKQLRNQVELQQNAMDVLKRRQRELYDDLDRRLRQRERLPGTGVDQQAKLVPEGDDLRPVTEDSGDDDQAQQAYDAAFNLLKQSRYGDSIKSFSGFLEQYPRSRFAPNAQYWIAEAHYVTREFEVALAEFQKLTKQYPDSQKHPDALLKIGYSQLELDKTEEGRQTLEDLIEQYPGAQVAISAKRRLEKDNP